MFSLEQNNLKTLKIFCLTHLGKNISFVWLGRLLHCVPLKGKGKKWVQL
jgi:hypothetical protein